MQIGSGSYLKLAMTDNWRDNLAKALKRKGLDMKAASRGAGLGETAVFDMLRRGRDPQMSTIISLAKAHDLSLDEIVNGTALSTPTGVRMIPVRGQVAAGLWYDDGDWDEPKYEDIPIVSEKYGNAPQEAFKVVGDSMDREGIVDGSFVTAVVPYWHVRNQIQDGDVVVVEQQEHGRRERTVKVVVIQADHYRLEARSTNPRWKNAFIIIPRDKPDHNDDRVVEIVGLVTGTYRKIGG